MKTPNANSFQAIVLLIITLFASNIAFAQLTQVTGFGSNPGALNMFKFVPANMPANAPLVVVLHGCTQTASQYATETGWNALANTYKFYVVYAEQNSSNNSSRCFNWFENGDITRGQGEALSIKQMTDNMKANHSIDAGKIFVTGLSAGGAMTAVMCATYPDVFRAGAVMAGLPYRAGIGSSAAFQAMSPGVDRTPQQWGDLVRNQNPSFAGTWPRMSVFHGSSDFTVRPMNMTELADQWTNVNGSDATADQTTTAFDGIPDITRRVYNNPSSQPVVITYDIAGMGHAISVDPGTSVKQGGATGGYSVDENFYSSYWAAEFFGILNTAPPTPPAAPSNLTATASSSSQINLSWSDNASDETGYVVERSTSSGSGFVSVATLGANVTSFSNTGLAASTTYFYRVRASNGAGSSANSNEASATTQAASSNPPAAPSNLTATATSSSQINLTWTDNASDETGYIVERSATSGSGFTSIATLGANATSFSNTGLTASTTYFYRVRATNAAGSSANSNEASATTQASAPPSSYTIQQPNGTTFISTLANDNTAQSFTSLTAGTITSVEFRLQQATTNTGLRIFAGNTVSGTPLYQQSGMNLGSGWRTITLTTPFAVSANTQYTLQLTRASMNYTPSNAYAGGNFWYNAISYTTFDAAFRVNISTQGGGGGGGLQSADESAPILVAENQEELAPQASEWLVYPNPANDVVSVVSPRSAQQKRLAVYDLLGKEMMSVELRGELQTVNCAQLPAGVYSVRLSDEKNVVVKKLVIHGR
jgi:poly(hydroxyalkanoate) depolymerase family esterase